MMAAVGTRKALLYDVVTIQEWSLMLPPFLTFIFSFFKKLCVHLLKG